jgi:hypothetical protein
LVVSFTFLQKNMKNYRTSFLSVAAFLMLLCSMSIFSRTATACPIGFSGPTSFTAVAGGSQSLTWTAIDEIGADILTTASITAGGDVFSLDRTQIIFPGADNAGDTAQFTVTFTPGANATGTFKGTITCGCGYTYEIVGTAAAAGVANSLPINVSITITPNPATDNINILSSGVRTAEIGVYDLLGKEIASSKTANWQWDASSIPTGAYIVRIVGESFSGDPFVISRRIIIAR